MSHLSNESLCNEPFVYCLMSHCLSNESSNESLCNASFVMRHLLSNDWPESFWSAPVPSLSL